MILSIELKHGRLAMKDSEAKKLAKFIHNAGDIEIRVAGRCIIIDDSAPLALAEPPPIKPRRKRGKRKVRNAKKHK